MFQPADAFQPAGVRKLLSMRSPSPSLPRTAPAKVRQDALEIVEDIYRPLTAPSLVGQSGGYPSSALARDDVSVESLECEGNDDGRDEPEVILHKVSTVLDDLQSRWAEQREHEIQQLWQQMEAEYGMEIPRCAPGTPAVGSLRARAGNGAPGFLCGAVVPEVQDDVGAHAIDKAPENADRETDEDLVTEAAKKDLEAAREFRKHMEARISTFRAASLDEKKCTSRSCENVEAEADVARLAQLRLEVDKLKARAEAPSVYESEKSRSSTEGVDAQADLSEPPLDALHAWMDDVWASSCSLPKKRGVTPRATASPQHRGMAGNLKRPPMPRSNPSSPTKKEMARLAEEKAMEWKESRHTGMSPRLKTGQHSPSKSPGKSMQLSSSGGRLHGSITSPKAIDPKPVTNSASTVENQLDELLKELDEIDRIHDDVCMLATP